MDSVVISIGGSVLVPGENDEDYIKSLADMISGLTKECKLFIVTGGGRIARFYISCGRSLGAEEHELDELGIRATRMNARLLALALGNIANTEPPKDIEGAAKLGENHAVVIMGGTVPGHTTDAVSAMLAEKVGASRLVNATNVDGVYDSDPRKNPGAKKIEHMSYKELRDISSGGHDRAGPNVIFDPKGVEIISGMGIPLLVCNGRDLDALKNAILGKEFSGTVVD